MAKFCTNCGKKLEEGEVCSCQKETKSKMATNSQANSIVNDYFEALKGLFTKPVSMLKKFSKEKYLTMGLISIAINAVLMGVFIHFMINNILGRVGINMNMLKVVLEQLNSQLSSAGIQVPTDMNFGISGFVAMGISSGIIIGLMYFFHSVVFKKKINVKEIVAMVGVSEICFSAGLLGSIILSFISPTIALLASCIFVIIFIVHLHQGLLEIGTINSNQAVYVTAACVLIPLILFLAIAIVLFFLDYVFQEAGKTISSSGLGF